MGLLRVERFSDHNAPILADELNDRSATPEGHLEQLVGNDPGVSPGEVETKTSVLGLHARGKRTALPQIHPRCCCVPVICSCVLLLVVVLRLPCASYLFNWSSNRGLYCDFHM